MHTQTLSSGCDSSTLLLSAGKGLEKQTGVISTHIQMLCQNHFNRHLQCQDSRQSSLIDKEKEWVNAFASVLPDRLLILNFS